MELPRLRDVSQASLGISATGFAGFSILMALGHFTGDAMVHRFGRAMVMRISGCLAAAGIGLALALPSPVTAMLGFFGERHGDGECRATPVRRSGACARIPPADGVAMAATMGYGAFLAGPPLIGFLAEVLGLRSAMLVPLLCAVTVAAAARR